MAIFGSLLAILVVLKVLAGLGDVPLSYLTQDPATVLGGRSYVGILSQFGVLMWCCAAVACLFSYLVLQGHADADLRTFLFLSGALSSLLMLDDLFRMHEVVLPKVLGIPEKLVYLSYAILTGCYLARTWRFVLTTRFLMLLLAFSFFALSLACDIVLEPYWDAEDYYLLEDGLKFLGIGSWLAYFSHECWHQVRRRLVPLSRRRELLEHGQLRGEAGGVKIVAE